MARISITLSFSSGTITAKVLLDLAKCDSTALPRVRNCRTICVQGYNEQPETYGKGTLTLSEEGNNSTFTTSAKVTQAVKDYLMSINGEKELNGTVDEFEPQSECIIIRTDIGIPKPTLSSNQADSKPCSKCKVLESKIPKPDPPRSDITDLCVALMYQHWSNRLTEGWSQLSTVETLKAWKQSLTQVKPAVGDSKYAWKNVNSGFKTNRSGLMRSLFHLHTVQKQKEIISGTKHTCSLLYRCPFQLMLLQESEMTKFGTSFNDFLASVISKEMISIYFFTERSKLGLALLRSFESDPPESWEDHPVTLLMSQMTPTINTKWIQPSTDD